MAEWRYIIRSKDRLSGTPNNFTVQLPNPIPDNVSDCSVKIQYVGLNLYPNPSDTSSVQAYNTTTGIYNQATSGTNNYGFDTGSGIDICINSMGTINTVDTESITATSKYLVASTVAGSTGTSLTIPVANKTGIFVGDTATHPAVPQTLTVTGFSSTGVTFSLPSATWTSIGSATTLTVTPAQPLKTRQDKTLLFVPYSRGDYLRLATKAPWTKLNPNNLSILNIKLFNDKGYPLKLRKLYASTAADSNDINIDDWYLELLVSTRTQLPKGASPHKI